MAEERVQRKLTTILAADVEGFGRGRLFVLEAHVKTCGQRPGCHHRRPAAPVATGKVSFDQT